MQLLFSFYGKLEKLEKWDVELSCENETYHWTVEMCTLQCSFGQELTGWLAEGWLVNYIVQHTIHYICSHTFCDQ